MTFKIRAYVLGNEFGLQSRMVFPFTNDGLNAARVFIANTGHRGEWHVYATDLTGDWNEGDYTE